VKLAVEYECRTGRSAGPLRIGQLMARIYTLRSLDKMKTMDMARAVATAMSGNEKAWTALMD
jgi:hypothetical protein